MRLSKFENEMNKYIDDKVKEAEREILRQAREAKDDARSHLIREVEIITGRLDRMDRKIDKQ